MLTVVNKALAPPYTRLESVAVLDRRVNVGPIRWGERWSDPWRVYWAKRLRDELRRATTAFASLLGLDPKMVGVVPAVYFTRLRMGSVPFLSWKENSPDIELAFPWGPTAALPPFTCFAPPIAREEEPRFGLIARVASIVDGLLIGERRPVGESKAADLAGVRASAFSWSDDDTGVTVVDEWILRDAGIRRTTTAFVLPPRVRSADPRWVPYVPLLYFQSAAPYVVEEAEAVLRAALGTARSNDLRAKRYAHLDTELRAIRDAVLVVAQAAHVRAREWVNQKTQLLSRAGFEGLKEDLQRRIALGEEYASVFFDIDRFKRANERFKYDGADLLAAALTDRVLAYTQTEVASAFTAHANARENTRAYAPTSPDGFRALLAHVSGDEFRFFIRTGTPRAPSTFDELDAMAFTENLVQAVAMKHSLGKDATRASRVLFARSAARRNLTRGGRDEKILGDRATVSAGVAMPRWKRAMTLAEINAVLNRSDLVAETAAGQAKKRGRNRVVGRRLRIAP